MSQKVTLKNAHLFDPSLGLDELGSLVFENGIIADIVKGRGADSGQVVDIQGMHVTPGFVDLRCQLGEPGFENKETIKTGTAAAAAGGFTTVCMLPLTQPVNDSGFVSQYIQEKLRTSAIVNVLLMGSVSQGLKGEAMAAIDSLVKSGCVALTDAQSSVMNSYLLRKTMEYVRSYGIPIVEHCEDTNLVGLGVMNEGLVSSEIGLRGIPAIAEEVIVSRDISLSGHAQARLHLGHLSSKGSVESLAHAKARGLFVTADVSPQHLLLTDEELRTYNTTFKLSPPLRTEQDRRHLVDALRSGIIDAVASDHNPQSDEDKDIEFEAALHGCSALETTWGAIYNLVKNGELPLSRAVESLTWSPAKVMNLKDRGQIKVGQRADLTVLNLNLRWKVNGLEFYSKSKLTPFDGREFQSQVIATYVGGRQVFDKQKGILL